MKHTFFPKDFTEKYARILGEKAPAFFSACSTKEQKYVWCNSLVIPPEKLVAKMEAEGWTLGPLGFHENAFAISGESPRPGADDAFKEGLFNLQEKAAMLPAIALNPKPGERVLDAFAAPGNKTLQLACLAKNQAEIIALEREPARMRVLEFNIAKFGITATAKRLDFQKFLDREGFDKILLDVPCSSEGLVRKRLDGLKEWSRKKVLNMAKRQKKAIVRGFDLLKPGGRLVYSTCSLSPEEDEEAIAHLLEKRPAAQVKPLGIKGIATSPGLQAYGGREYPPEVKNCSRLYPHEWDCQPFFIAVIEKTS
ncbi:MAG: RsmB/NOP family class I SAM-dependent RNA methyltransferase [Candidatus Micrarchaeia archaeon]|jgi:NOL1/NOP2/sun family putative RNA methylase